MAEAVGPAIITPGMGHLVSKAFAEGWSKDDFVAAQWRFRQAYLHYSPKGQWPRVPEQYDALLKSLFGERPKVQRNLFGQGFC